MGVGVTVEGGRRLFRHEDGLDGVLGEDEGEEEVEEDEEDDGELHAVRLAEGED